MNALNVRSWADVRALIHVGAPVISAALVSSGIANQHLSGLIVALVLAVLSPALAMVNTVDGFRVWFYPVVGTVAPILIYLNFVSEFDYSTWLPVIAVFIGPAVAAANTPTSAAE